tara:strand:- start:677 stop:1018 length:342 start_codon:yes stop_codon:yes gene_type:complete
MSERRSRIFRVKSDSPSRIVVSDDIVRIIGDKNNFLTVTSGFIGLNSDKVVIKAMPENIIKGIIFRESPGFAQTIPSSVVTPIPNLIMNIPGAGLVKNISQGTAGLAALNFVG